MPIKAITLDFWDTIFKMKTELDPRELRLNRMRSVFNKFRLDLKDEELTEAYKDVWKKFEKEWIDNHRTLTTTEIIDYFLIRLNINIPKKSYYSLINYFQDAILESPPLLMENVKTAIINLSTKFKLGIISDTGFTPGKVLHKILELNDLAKYFNVLVFSDEFGRSKPTAEIFLYAAKTLGVKPEELVHIGDSERTDIAGAIGVNAKAILFTKGNHFSNGTKAHAVLRYWRDIELVLQEFEIND